LQFADDPAPTVRRAAILALMEREEPRALPRFEQELAREDSALTPPERERLNRLVIRLRKA
jgi:hypothetical protein